MSTKELYVLLFLLLNPFTTWNGPFYCHYCWNKLYKFRC